MQKRNRAEVLLDMLQFKTIDEFNDEKRQVKTGNVWIHLEEDYEYIKIRLQENGK